MQDTSVISSYSDTTKTLTAKWMIENFDQLLEQVYKSDTFSSDFNPTISWKFSVTPSNESHGNVMISLIKLNEGNIIDGKADCRINASIGTDYSTEHRSIVSLETNTKLNIHIKFPVAWTRAAQLNPIEIEVNAIITYTDALDHLVSEFDDQTNTLEVNWAIPDYPVTHPPLLYYESKSFESTKFPNSKWVLAVTNTSDIFLLTENADNHVKAIVTAKLGQHTISPSLLPIDFYNESYRPGVRYQVHDLVSRIIDNALTVELTIEYQVVEDAVAKCCRMLLRHSYLLDADLLPVFTIITTNVNEYDMDTVKALVDYLHTNSTTVTTVRSTLTLMEAAHCYNMNELFITCEDFICKYVTSKDVLKVLMKCHALSAKRSFETCLELLRKESKCLDKYPDFQEFNKFDRYGLAQTLVNFMIANK